MNPPPPVEDLEAGKATGESRRRGLGVIAGGTLAAGSHATKAGTRAIINTSPGSTRVAA